MNNLTRLRFGVNAGPPAVAAALAGVTLLTAAGCAGSTGQSRTTGPGVLALLVVVMLAAAAWQLGQAATLARTVAAALMQAVRVAFGFLLVALLIAVVAVLVGSSYLRLAR